MPINQSSKTSLLVWNKFDEVRPTKYLTCLVVIRGINEPFVDLAVYDDEAGHFILSVDDDGEYPDYYFDEDILFWAQMPKAPI